MQAPLIEATSTRDAYFDNARLFLMVLVVLGHVVRPEIGESWLLRGTYITVYTFHMPMFVLISGYLSRRPPRTMRDYGVLSVRLLMPYLVFQLAWSVVGWFTTDRFRFAPDRPAYTLWFLMALFVWRATLPLLQRWAWALPATMVIGVVAAFFPIADTRFTIGRLLSLWPFFLAGTMLDRAWFSRLTSARARRGAALVFGVGTVVLFLASSWIQRPWLLAHQPYQEQGLYGLAGPLVRIGSWIVACAMGLAFLSLVSSRRTWVSALGARTLTIYLLHGFFVRAGQVFGFYELVDSSLERVVLPIAGLGLAVLLGWEPLHRIVVAITQPRFLIDRLKRRPIST